MGLNQKDEPLARAESLLAGLSSIYSDFTEKNTEEGRPATKKITRLFARWFTGFNPLTANPEHQAFLNEVQHVIAQLTSLLEEIKPTDPGMCKHEAAKAVAILMPPRSGREKTAADWSLTVAEYQVVFLLPYLSKDELGNLRAKLLKRTPKRLMLPKQLELLKMIDTLLRP